MTADSHPDRRARSAETLFHAALLSGLGARAGSLADAVGATLAAATAANRSCLDAGADLQLTIDAPGPARLRFGVRAGRSPEAVLASPTPLLGEPERAALRPCLSSLGPPRFPPSVHFGTWLFREGERTSVFLDIRDGSPRHAVDRVRPLLDAEGLARLDRAAVLLDAAHPWSLRLDTSRGRVERIHLSWLVSRHREPGPLAEALGLGEEWRRAAALFAGPLGESPSAHAWPWLFTTPLDGATPPGLRVGTSALARSPDGAAKRGRLLHALRDLGGPAEHADALLHLLTSGVPPERRFRVARALEVRADTRGSERLRLYLVPCPEPPAR